MGSFCPAAPAPEAAPRTLKVSPAVHRDLALTSALLGWETGPAAFGDIPIAVGRAR